MAAILMLRSKRFVKGVGEIMEKIVQELLPDGWYIADIEESERLHAELQKELPSGHLLKNIQVEVVAHRDGATDDILCRHLNNEERFTVVHLSWRMKVEIDYRFPTIEVDGSFDEFRKYETKLR